MEKQIGIEYPDGCGFPDGKICIKCAVKWEKTHAGEYDTDSGKSTSGIFDGEGFTCSLCGNKFGTSAAAAAMGRVKSERKAVAVRENGKKGGRPPLQRHAIIIADMRDGNVQRVTRHNVTTALGAARLRRKNSQIWMTRETAIALGLNAESFWGRFQDGTEFQVKTDRLMEEA